MSEDVLEDDGAAILSQLRKSKKHLGLGAKMMLRDHLSHLGLADKTPDWLTFDLARDH